MLKASAPAIWKLHTAQCGDITDHSKFLSRQCTHLPTAVKTV